MSNRHEDKVRTIHPRALSELGEEACIVALGVACDLRSGVIPPDEFDMFAICGSACCIAGHMAIRLGIDAKQFYFQSALKHKAIDNLFAHYHPSDPILAADAIERYVYFDSKNPWKSA